MTTITLDNGRNCQQKALRRGFLNATNSITTCPNFQNFTTDAPQQIQQLPAPYKRLINGVNRPTNNRRIETDQWLLTNFTRVLQPITSRLNWPIMFNGPDLITPSTDSYSSLDSEDFFHTGCRNVRHQQQFFSELLSAGRSHYMNYGKGRTFVKSKILLPLVFIAIINVFVDRHLHNYHRPRHRNRQYNSHGDDRYRHHYCYDQDFIPSSSSSS